MNKFGRIIMGCMLFTAVYIPLIGKGQPVLISGQGQLLARPSDSFYGGIVDYYNFLPKRIPLAKTVTITTYDLWSDFGELKRIHGDGYARGTKIMYDSKGNVETLLSTSSGTQSVLMLSLMYEKHRIVEIVVRRIDANKVLEEVAEKMTKPSLFLAQFPGEQVLFKRKSRVATGVTIDNDDSFTFNILDIHDLLDSISIEKCVREKRTLFRYKYDSDGLLESAMGRPDGSAMYGTYYVKYELDGKRNITGVSEFKDAEKIKSNQWTFQYDANHRMVAYYDVGNIFDNTYCYDHRWNYDKKGNLVSYRRSYYRNDKKNEEHEYKFEYGEDGNPIRCIDYLHGDITIIKGGYEYSYEYTFYPDPKEQERKEALEKREQIKRDSIQLVTQRKNDSINLEEQRKESLRQKRNKELLQVCEFLFDSNEEYESCVVKKNDIAEQDIKGRVVKKLQYVYPLVLNGKELRKEKQPGRNDLIQICNMCVQLNSLKSQCDNEEIEIINHICDYTESKLGDFVSGRSALNKAFKKTSNMSYSSFLLSYMNDK